MVAEALGKSPVFPLSELSCKDCVDAQAARSYKNAKREIGTCAAVGSYALMLSASNGAPW